MKIVFIGTVEFSRKILEHLLSLNADVVGICTSKGNNFNSDYSDLTGVAENAQIPIHYTSDINSKESINWIENLGPEVVFCFGWSRLLSTQLINVAPKGVVGFHPSLLPSNRGRHPLIWALALGLNKTGSTFFYMNENADEGEILSQEEVIISYEDSATTVYEKVSQTAKNQLTSLLSLLESGSETKVAQSNIKSNVWRKRTDEDSKIDWRMSSRAIYNLVRALTHPYIGAHTTYNGKVYKIWKVSEFSSVDQNHEPGKILSVEPGKIVVKCSDGAIILHSVTPQLDIQVGEYL
jgi:methionyl-tRNA formyltransferase